MGSETIGLAEAPSSFERADALQFRCAAMKAEFPAHVEELERAAEQIDRQSMPAEVKLAAFARAADAITDGIKIFVSYKSEDAGLATLFIDKLAEYGLQRLKKKANQDPDIFFAEQSLAAGVDWRDTIKKRLKDTHWFILLLPDTSLARDWLLWEGGLFEADMMREGGEKLICVHHPDVSMASQFENYQNCKGHQAGIKRLFNELFFTADAIPGMRAVAPPFKARDLDDDAKLLAARFANTPTSREPLFCLSHVDIAHTTGVTYTTDQELLDARVLRGHDLAAVFNRDETFKGTVGDLIADVYDQAHGTAWVGMLRKALSDVVAGKPARRAAPPFVGHGDDPTQYRPCLHCILREGPGGAISSFRVLFIEEFGGQVSNVPAKIDALEASLRWSYRSWWEVLERYRDRALSMANLETIQQYVERAEQEMLARNAMDPALLRAAFADRSAEQTKLDAFQADYAAKFRDPVTGQGMIDKAFVSHDPQLLSKALDALRPRVAWFLVHGARRYAEILEARLIGELPIDDTVPPGDSVQPEADPSA
jgi:hypothetical protein